MHSAYVSNARDPSTKVLGCIIRVHLALLTHVQRSFDELSYPLLKFQHVLHITFILVASNWKTVTFHFFPFNPLLRQLRYNAAVQGN